MQIRMEAGEDGNELISTVLVTITQEELENLNNLGQHCDIACCHDDATLLIPVHTMKIEVKRE
jgi:hypothetical protein